MSILITRKLQTAHHGMIAATGTAGVSPGSSDSADLGAVALVRFANFLARLAYAGSHFPLLRWLPRFVDHLAQLVQRLRAVLLLRSAGRQKHKNQKVRTQNKNSLFLSSCFERKKYRSTRFLFFATTKNKYESTKNNDKNAFFRKGKVRAHHTNTAKKHP